MKRLFSVVMLIVMALTSCNKDTYHYKDLEPGYGILSFADANIIVSEETETRAATDNYCIWVLNSDGAEVDLDKNSDNTYLPYSTIASTGIKLPAGNYTLIAQSQTTIPAAAFEEPIYGAEQPFTINAGQETTLNDITCKLWKQVKVTVGYNDFFIEHLAGAGVAKVTVNNGNPLEYYINSSTDKEDRPGYFEVPKFENKEDKSDIVTLVIEFVGLMKDENGNPKTQKMRAAVDNVKAGQWRKIQFNMEEDKDGNAAFTITIGDLVVDAVLGEDVTTGEESLENDPNKPKGDGGIKLNWTAGSTDEARAEWNAYNTISTNENTGKEFINKPSIVINDLTELVFEAVIPNNIGENGSFTVDITSTNSVFEDAVELVSPTRHIDLIEDTATIESLKTFGINFPSGEAVTSLTTEGDKVLTFNLSQAVDILMQIPYIGTHTFTMSIQDATGCSNIIALNLTIEE